MSIACPFRITKLNILLLVKLAASKANKLEYINDCTFITIKTCWARLFDRIKKDWTGLDYSPVFGAHQD